MGKRQRGYGAVYRWRDGRWEGQIRIPGGGRRSFYAKTRRDVIHRLSQERWALGQGLPVSAGTTSLETFEVAHRADAEPHQRVASCQTAARRQTTAVMTTAATSRTWLKLKISST